jgi:hypothetical protein
MSIEPTRARCRIGHRRGFLVASAALGAALLLPTGSAAAQVKVLQGGVRVNGKKASKTSAIRAGDTVETAKGARLVFVIGEDAFLLRGDSKLMLERTSGGQTLVITGLRLLSGALLAAFAPGARRIETPTATAGIRGTGVYLEASKEQTYFCTCYGVVELRDKAGIERKVVISGYHTPNMIFANPAERGRMTEAEVKGHTDEELIMLERLVGRTSPIVQRNQKLKEASQPEGAEQPRPVPEQKPAEQSAAPKKEAPSDEKPAPDKSKSSSEPPPEETAAPNKSKSSSEPPPEETAAPKKAAPEDKPPQKPGKKSRTQKQKPKPVEAAPPETPVPEKAPATETPELGPSPIPPQQPPQPPAQEYRLPPPRLDN